MAYVAVNTHAHATGFCNDMCNLPGGRPVLVQHVWTQHEQGAWASSILFYLFLFYLFYSILLFVVYLFLFYLSSFSGGRAGVVARAHASSSRCSVGWSAATCHLPPRTGEPSHRRMASAGEKKENKQPALPCSSIAGDDDDVVNNVDRSLSRRRGGGGGGGPCIVVMMMMKSDIVLMMLVVMSISTIASTAN